MAQKKQPVVIHKIIANGHQRQPLQPVSIPLNANHVPAATGPAVINTNQRQRF